MKRYLKWIKGKDGRLRVFGYLDDDSVKQLFGICYSSDFQTLEILPKEYSYSAQELIDLEGGSNGNKAS